MDLQHSKEGGLSRKPYTVLHWFLQLIMILSTSLTTHNCFPTVAEADKSSTVYSTARTLQVPMTRHYVDYMKTSATKISGVAKNTMESPESYAKSSTDAISSVVRYESIIHLVPTITSRSQTELEKFAHETSQPLTTEATEISVNRSSESSARRIKRALPMFTILPLFGLFRGLSAFGTMYPQWDYDIEKDGLKTSDIYPVKALKAVKEIVEKTNWDKLFMSMVTLVVNDFVDRILQKIFEKKDRSLDLWPSLRIPALTRVQRLKRSVNGQQLWHSSGAHRLVFPERRNVECNLRDICQAGRLLSRLPALQQLTMQLRSTGHESQWEAFLWGMRKKRCSRIMCKRGRAPKGSRVPWHLHYISS